MQSQLQNYDRSVRDGFARFAWSLIGILTRIMGKRSDLLIPFHGVKCSGRHSPAQVCNKELAAAQQCTCALPSLFVDAHPLRRSHWSHLSAPLASRNAPQSL
eukprot:8869638-Pyramimonas_sp.AAC.1